MASRRLAYSCVTFSRAVSASKKLLWRTYADVIPPPPPDGAPKAYSPKIESIVDDISQLTLIETAQLNELLKVKLNIPDMPMSMGAFPAPAQAASEQAEEEEVKTAFTVKLMSFKDGAKVKVIKEIKALMEGMSLVQAKKFVESTPQVVKKDIKKEDADKLKATLEEAGASVQIE